jgi:hypothetical protein
VTFHQLEKVTLPERIGYILREISEAIRMNLSEVNDLV